MNNKQNCAVIIGHALEPNCLSLNPSSITFSFDLQATNLSILAPKVPEIIFLAWKIRTIIVPPA